MEKKEILVEKQEGAQMEKYHNIPIDDLGGKNNPQEREQRNQIITQKDVRYEH